MKKILSILILSLFLINCVSALVHKQNTILDLKITCLNDGYCSNESFCNINILDPNANLIVTNQNMTYNITYYNYTITPTEIGNYCVSGFCRDGELSDKIDFCFLVSTDGNELSIQDSLVRIFLILFFISLLFVTYFIIKKTDFEKWNNAIIKKYQTKNIVKMVLSALLYNIMKNPYLIYYLIGLPIIMIITNLTYAYNITALVEFMNVFLFIYTVGIVIVGLIFLSYIQEWIAETMELINNLDWGIN